MLLNCGVIYLDHNATTPIAAEVLEAMLPYFKQEWGNPSSSYRFGSKLKSVIEDAREKVADLVGANPLEILFTSCGTESNNTAINAALQANPAKRHLVTSLTEHSSVLSHFKFLEKQGYEVTYLSVDREGMINFSDLEASITEKTALVSLMWANNETGALLTVDKIGAYCRNMRVLYHCDGVQAVGKLPVNLKALPIDYLSLTGHKLGAPKGIGALFIRKRTAFTPYHFGGHQERERRGGTESVPLIVGLGEAAKSRSKTIHNYETTVAELRDKLEEEIVNNVPGAQINGSRGNRLGNTSSVYFPGINSEALLLMLDQNGLCASSGSACLADSPEPSHVILAMSKSAEFARSTIRFSLSHLTTAEEIKRASHVTIQSVKTFKR